MHSCHGKRGCDEGRQHHMNRLLLPCIIEHCPNGINMNGGAMPKDCRIGYFGASTGAASALKAAAFLPHIGAVVSRGGRPDLAMNNLPNVDAPTLLIVGSLDDEVLQLNQEAYEKLECEKKLEVVEGATHLFEEP